MGQKDLVYSNINVAMETYHSHIGSRLSDLYLPTPPISEEGEHLSTAFCFLTFNPRRENKRRKMNKLPLVKIPTRNKEQLNCAGNPAPTISSANLFTPSDASISYSKGNNIELPQRRKLTFKERLTRFFLKKPHVCCRCKRKSRGCIQNKTFNGIEKHYTCRSCREASNAVKNFFDKKSDCNFIGLSNSSKVYQKKGHNSAIHEGQYKDSGYETVASVCSTLTASANSSLRKGKDITTFKSGGKDIDIIDSTRNNSLPQIDESRRKSKPDTCNPYLPTNPTSSQVGIACRTTAPQTSHPATLEESLVKDLRQIKQIKLRTYDGYLPDICQNISGQNQSWKILTEATQANHSPENDLQSLPPGMVKLKKSDKNVTLGQKTCHICDSSFKEFFRLPWEGGWVCEDCLDRLH